MKNEAMDLMRCDFLRCRNAVGRGEMTIEAMMKIAPGTV